MSTADRRLSGRRAWRSAIALLVLAVVIAIAWLLFGSGLSNGIWDDNTGHLISERWVQIYYDRNSPDTGPDGDVTIVAFLDYNSAECRAAAVALRKLRDADKGVRIVFKELPMSGSSDELAARAALAARKQDRHLQLQRAILQGPSEMTETAVIKAAGLAGLDIQQLRPDMADPAIVAAIDQNRILAREFGIRLMPAFIIGNRFYRGPVDLEHLQSAVVQARRDAAS